MAYDNPPDQTSPSGGVSLGARVEIFPGQALPDFNTPGGLAFSARARDEAASDLMAVLCNTSMPPRTDVISSMRSVDHISILRMIESGVVHWPDDTRYFAIAYQRPLSPRLTQSFAEVHPPMSEDTINHYFVNPMIGALLELQRTGVVHNAIRPDNIFWRIGSATPPQLGECLSVPAGVGQPVLFETLERAMSTPIGRGPGIHADDCYAFGVVLALLVLGQNPLQGMDNNAIIQTKIDRGSFGSLVGNRRLLPTQIELLRGLLNDDARQRWSASDLEQWLNGRRLTPKNTDTGRRAQRFFEFAGKEFWQLRPLAAAMAANIGESVKCIESGNLDKWLRRALGDEDKANEVSNTQASLKSSGKTSNYEDQIVARTCIVLDPPSPIHYRGLAVMPAGVSGMMVDAITTGQNVQALSEIISSQLVTLWVEMQKDVNTDLMPLAQQFERMKSFIEKTSFGNGFERVVYELSPNLQCLSPILRAQYVTSPKGVLAALERVAALPNRSREPMDRHIASFLIVRERRSESLFEAMTTSESSPRKGIALLTLFADMQSKYGPDALPNLAQWLMPFLEVSTKRYLSKSLREKMQKLLREAATRGDLNTLLRLIDDPRRIERDQQEFMAARMLYLNILRETAHLETHLANRESVIQSIGKPMAASISSFLAIIMVVVAILRVIWQNLMS